jgi:hypothetical protein
LIDTTEFAFEVTAALAKSSTVFSNVTPFSLVELEFGGKFYSVFRIE